MITFKADEASRILTIEMVGMISEADIEAAVDQLEAEFPAVGVHVRGVGQPFNVLSDWEKLEGWEKGAKTLGTVTSKLISEAVRKHAVIADAKWAGEQARLADIARHAEVRFFPPEERAAAKAWLGET